jgi:hypothetical protein
MAPRREHRPIAAAAPAQAAAMNPRAAATPVSAATPANGAARAKSDAARAEQAEPMVARREYDRLQEQLAVAEEMLGDALAESAEG